MEWSSTSTVAGMSFPSLDWLGVGLDGTGWSLRSPPREDDGVTDAPTASGRSRPAEEEEEEEARPGVGRGEAEPEGPAKWHCVRESWMAGTYTGDPNNPVRSGAGGGGVAGGAGGGGNGGSGGDRGDDGAGRGAGSPPPPR